MLNRLRDRVRRAYLRELESNIENAPQHVAVIQDGNRRYARERGLDSADGHAAGAQTTEELLRWCEDVGIRELTLYAFSTENFARPPDELEHLFDLIEEKLHSFADADLIHEREVRIRGLGDIERLPDRVVDAVEYAEAQTDGYGRLQLNVALAYGGRNELLRSAKQLAREAAEGEIEPSQIDIDAVEERLYREPIRNVDLIIRTGGDERTSNFLPWYANGNEAAVYFCTPYWPEFGKTDFFRAIRTYESREESWQRTRFDRAMALVRHLAEVEYVERREVAARITERLTPNAANKVDALLEGGDEPAVGDGSAEREPPRPSNARDD